MKKDEIKRGGLYLAKVNDQLTTVRVDEIRESQNYAGEMVTRYSVTNMKTGRQTTFRSAAKFRAEVKPKQDTPAQPKKEGEQSADPTPATTTAKSSPLPTLAQPNAPTSVGQIVSSAVAAGSQPFVRANLGIAAKLAASSAARTARQIGSLIAGMKPNDEQEEILAIAPQDGLKVLVIGAGAGTGKTATLKMIEQILRGRGQYTAFNTALVAESKTKFVKASCNTTHSLAFRAVGKTYQHRLNGDRMRSGQIANILGITSQQVLLKGAGPAETDAFGVTTATDKVKTLQAEFLAGQVLVAIRKFCQGDERCLSAAHIRYIDGIDIEGSRENNDRVKAYLLPFVLKAWDDLSNVNGQLPFSHDIYVKIWQLGTGDDRPIIAADYILLDEAQDTAPVFLDVLRQQKHALLVLVGDENQQIYEWRGAVNAMADFPDAPRRLLSQSYRFGQKVADVANAILRTLEVPTDLVMKGNPALSTDICGVENPRCYLYRSNAGAIGRLMACLKEGKTAHIIGKNDDIIAWCQAAIDLKAKRGTRHPELCCFESWGEVVEYSKTDEGSEMRLMVKLITEFGAKQIRDALNNMPSEDKADCVISTAHKSKGREWDTVKLGQDFPTVNKMGDSDKRLLYVAATRAKGGALDISECPPFCGGYDGPEDAREWIPGIEIVYTTPAPVPEATSTPEQENTDEWVATPKATSLFGPARIEQPQPTPTPYVRQAATGFGWTKFNDVWCVRGPSGAFEGDEVSVERRDGSKSTVVIKTILKDYPDATIYGI